MYMLFIICRTFKSCDEFNKYTKILCKKIYTSKRIHCDSNVYFYTNCETIKLIFVDVDACTKSEMPSIKTNTVHSYSRGRDRGFLYNDAAVF